VGRETKFGLVVGLAFIVLFGIILSSRAATTSSEHAVLPTGESVAHASRVQALRGPIDPLAGETALDVRGAGTVTPVVDEATPGDVAPVPAPDSRVTLGFGPATGVETPLGADHSDNRLALLDGGASRPLVAPARPVAAPVPADPSKATYTVKAGDTLSAIAKLYYGKDTPKLWQQIVDANKLKDPKRLVVGQKLVIPNLPAAAPKADAPKTDTPMREVPRTAPPAPAAPLGDSLDSALAELRASGRTPARGPAPTRLTADEAGRLVGGQTDLVEAPPTPVKTYTIQAGDTFGKIAAKYYGDAARYGKLLALKNPNVDPARLQIGQRIVLLDGPTAAATDSTVASR
jgi:nucleoid-associated protein YgaU